jgi:hypothetical protein
MKTFFWDKLPDARLHNTLWLQLSPAEWIDFDALEEAFSQVRRGGGWQVVKAVGRGSGAPSALRRRALVSSPPPRPKPFPPPAPNAPALNRPAPRSYARRAPPRPVQRPSRSRCWTSSAARP